MSKHIFERIADAWAEHVAKVDPEELSLKNFPLPIPEGEEFDRIMAEVEVRSKKRHEEQEEFRKKYEPIYGDGWFLEYCKATGFIDMDFDDDMKLVNTWIYKGKSSLHITTSAEHHRQIDEMYEQRERYLYGDMYDKLHRHWGMCRKAGELLLQDALKTGRWKELPDELQVRYHKLVGDIK